MFSSEDLIKHFSSYCPTRWIQWKLHVDLVEWGRKLGEISECQHFMENRKVMPDKMLKACETVL